jgi:hypothetical protein
MECQLSWIAVCCGRMFTFIIHLLIYIAQSSQSFQSSLAWTKKLIKECGIVVFWRFCRRYGGRPLELEWAQVRQHSR